MTMIAPDDENSLGPDLAAPVNPFPDTPRGRLAQQIDAATQAAQNARTIAAQYIATAEAGEARIVQLTAQLDALPEDE